ncbi:MAG: hypothetical protein ACOYVD_11525 [Bacillota bacterium]
MNSRKIFFGTLLLMLFIFSYTFLPDNFFEFKLTKNKSIDLDKDGIKEDILLKNGTVNIKSGTQSIWQSPENWWVDYFLVGDINNDGVPELNMLVWKEGSFGESKPFWITEEDKNVKNHLFVFKLRDGAVKPVWQSSNLDNPNFYIEIADINGDGENELIAVEGSYVTPGERRITHWKWNGWGFTRIE